MSIGHGLLHFFIPKCCLFGKRLGFGGSFAWHNIFLRFCGCLNATIGGCLNMFDSFLSLTIVLQCFAMIEETLGSFGLNVIANVTLSVFVFTILSSAVSLGMSRALWIEFSTMFLLYCLDMSIVFSSSIRTNN